MKISAVEPILLRLPRAPDEASFADHDATSSSVDTLMVRVETDAGVTGWGEAFGFATVPVTLPAIRDVIAPLAVGQEAGDIAALTAAIKRRLQNMMRGGPARFALSALDIALWDIKGQVEGKPVWQLLGGSRKARVPAYASLFRLGDPDIVARTCREAVAKGFGAVKLHERTVEAVAAARDALGPDRDLMVDVNCAWDAEEAIEAARAMAPYRIGWLEEPVSPPDDYTALARVRREGGVPVAGGENFGNPNDVRWAAMMEALDIMQPSVIKHGGISDVWRIVEGAKGTPLRIVPHSPFVGPGLTATVHIVASMDGAVPCEYRYCDLLENPLGDAVCARNGFIAIPDGPGLGIAVDPDVIGRCRQF